LQAPIPNDEIKAMANKEIKNEFMLSLVDLAAFLDQEPAHTLKEIETAQGKQPMKSILFPSVVRKYLATLGYKYPHQVISFQMLKGGVAKTTSALNFGIRASQFGAKVLFIDMDQQANLTFALGIESEELPVWVDVVEKKKTAQQAILEVDENLHLIPSSLNNSVLDRVLLNGQRNWAQAVNTPLKELRSTYDLVVIDTAPNLSAINTAVTCASDQVVLPINPDKFSLLGLKKHLQDLAELRSEFGLSFTEKILFTKFDGREAASREFLSQCLEQFEDRLMKHYIRTSTDIKNSIGSGRTIFNTKSNAKEDYDLVTKELMEFI
jgi:chromosome partitioning protein